MLSDPSEWLVGCNGPLPTLPGTHLKIALVTTSVVTLSPMSRVTKKIANMYSIMIKSTTTSRHEQTESSCTQSRGCTSQFCGSVAILTILGKIQTCVDV
jgi:hypothetical protein